MLATTLKTDFLDSQLIDEVAHRLQLPREEVEAEDEQPGSLLSRLLLALGAANTEPMIPPETASVWTPPNADPVFDTRRAVLQLTQDVIREAARGNNVVIVGRG
ncbi:MAG: cytidylate kinase-like family protein, partial [Chloroflexi bacterium]